MNVNRFLSPEPAVTLVNSFREPFKNALAAARTCYSGKGVIREEDLAGDYQSLGKSIYAAGHHTNFQHAQFQFTISNVSRQCIWSFLHSHPFYNSEQVSQRYVAVKPGTYAIPPLEGSNLELYALTAGRQMEAYHRLVDILTPVAEEYYYSRFPQRKNQPDKYRKACIKKAQEVARYVLPIATFAYLYHTLSGITLMRYYRICQMQDTPSEQFIIVKKMVNELLRLDPQYQSILEEPIPLEETPEYEFFQAHPALTSLTTHKEFLAEFDQSLGGKSALLIDWKTRQEEVLAQSVREVLGVTREILSDEEAVALALDPGKNRLLGETMNLTTHGKITRCLYHAGYTFRKKISHTADSQDQRHRMTPASRPVMAAHITDEPDYIIPELIKQDGLALQYYIDTMAMSWKAVNTLKSKGVSDEFAHYLLPNALSIRFTESADLLNLRHKHIMRLCFNAQEEIWRATLEEAQQISEINPLIGRYLRPPCSQRAMGNIKPYCPEGERFCGVPVWQQDPDEYQRII